MKELHSFLYPQGFHIGHLFLIVKNIGDGNFTYPFNPETYYPKAYGETKGAFERQFAYKIWALMEMGILDDHRKTQNHLSYQNLTELGKKLYETFDRIDFPNGFFDRRAPDSWDMTYDKYKFIVFTKSLENDCPEAFEIIKDVILAMRASKDLIKYFLEKGIGRIKRQKLYEDYFTQEYIRQSFKDRDMTPPSKSIETARRRVSVIIGLLECIDVMKGWGGIASEPVTLIKVPQEIFETEEETIESEITEKASVMTAQQMKDRLSELEEKLQLIEPTYPIKHSVGVVSPSYPRNKELEVLMKRMNNYTCQCCSEKGFKKENGGLYIECHHMVPMSLAEKYGANPDVPSNILVVCSWCHRKLEKGSSELKKKIYDELVKKGIIPHEKMEELEKFGLI